MPAFKDKSYGFNAHVFRTLWPYMFGLCLVFFAVDCLSLHTGDDLGYLFADTVHHGGDGPRVTSLKQCLDTQVMHYQTTNGRFLVHLTVMAFLNLMPLWMFRLLNALIFTLLVFMCCSYSGRPTPFRFTLCAFLLLVALPTPAMLLFTLVSYAVNYVWVAAAVLGFLLLWRRGCSGVGSKVLLGAVAFITGSLQESFSVPVCAGMAAVIVLRWFGGETRLRCPWWLFVCMVAGTAVCVFAPGNQHHAAQGGGFSIDAVIVKTLALQRDMPYTIIFWAFIVWFILLIFQISKNVRDRRKICHFTDKVSLEFLRNQGNTPDLHIADKVVVHNDRKYNFTSDTTALSFLREHLFEVVTILAALFIACLTYTSPRQLTCPCLFAILMLSEAIREPKRPGYYITAFVAASVVFLAVVTIFRIPIRARYNALIQNVQSMENTHTAYPCGFGHLNLATFYFNLTDTVLRQYPALHILDMDPDHVTYLNRALKPDPLMNVGLVAVGDRYTIQGLRRLYNAELKTIAAHDDTEVDPSKKCNISDTSKHKN